MNISGRCFVQPRVDCSGASTARSVPATTSGRQPSPVGPGKTANRNRRSKSEGFGAHVSPTAVRVLKDEAEQPLIGFGEVVDVADLKGVRVVIKKGQPEVQYLVAWKV